ncbi:MAG TPA: imidazole glycerol phosphate synthase subunit HisH, partial [Micrococcus luteus]|nr:imidazole glycerol phosphate synthase subunit HisH [Micrococcus luteus]
HMGWNTVEAPEDSRLFAGLDADARYYFVHSYAAHDWTLEVTNAKIRAPKVTWSTHGERFVAAVENGALWATQFHPEKSGDAGAQLLTNWIETL